MSRSPRASIQLSQAVWLDNNNFGVMCEETRGQGKFILISGRSNITSHAIK